VGPRIAGGSFADLHMGVYCGQTVAVKVLRTDPTAVGDAASSAALQEEFVKEVSILRKVRERAPCREPCEQALAGQLSSSGSLA
jgi:hypothetical protein